jgi:outer membrane protein TolC
VPTVAAASDGGSGGEMYPIDLSSALALGGANNLQIQFVRERVNEAYLNLSEARLMWVPSLRAGIGYNRHDGRVQATEGEVIDASRNSLFIGGGAAWGSSPITGGGVPPARLVMDLSLADAWFTKLAARQTACAAQAESEATMNDALLAIGSAYFDLVEAHGLMSNAQAGLEAADRMLDLTKKFADQGQISPSEVARAEAEQGLWRQAVEDARRLTITRGAELARLLRLDPKVALVPGEDRIIPLEIVKDSGVDELVSTGLANRPELQQYRHLVAAADERIRQEAWRPWLPYMAVGYRHQMQTTSDSIQAADRTVRLTEQRINQGVALPIELIQAIRARATGQDAHTKALTNHNRSQLRLLRAVGQPPTSGR